MNIEEIQREVLLGALRFDSCRGNVFLRPCCLSNMAIELGRKTYLKLSEMLSPEWIAGPFHRNPHPYEVHFWACAEKVVEPLGPTTTRRNRIQN